MGNLNFVTYKRIFSIQRKYCLVFIVVLLATISITEVLFFDTTPLINKYGDISKLEGVDRDVFYPIFCNAQISLQGYIFGFAFFLLFDITFFVFSSILLAKNFERDIVTASMRIGSLTKSIKQYLWYILLNNLISFLLFFPTLILMNFIINLNLGTTIDLMVFNSSSLITSVILFVVYSLTIIISCNLNFRGNKIINLLREIF